MIDFTYDPECDTFTGVTEIGTYVAAPTGRHEVRRTDHPHKNTVVYVMTYRPIGADKFQGCVLGEGREASVTVMAMEHYIANGLLVPSY